MIPKKLLEEDFLELEYQFAKSLVHTVKLFSDLGRNVIAESVFLDEKTEQKPETIKEAVSFLSNYPVLFVYVVCNKGELNIK